MSLTWRRLPADMSAGPTQPPETTAAVAEFRRAFKLPRRRSPRTRIAGDPAKLRAALLREQVDEFVAAAEKADLIGIAEALADIVDVVYGTALTYGIDLNSVLREVHRSNMSKLAGAGKPLLREDGKVLKSERYFAPDIASALGLDNL